MNKIPERLGVFVTQRFILNVLNAVCVLAAGCFITYEVGNVNNIWLIVAAAMIEMRYANSRITSYLVNAIYGGDADEIHDEIDQYRTGEPKQPEEVEAHKEIKIQIVDHSDNFVAMYRGAECYEWIDIKINDKVTRVSFFGTIDMSRGYSVPEGCILLSPGVVYELDIGAKKYFLESSSK